MKGPCSRLKETAVDTPFIWRNIRDISTSTGAKPLTAGVTLPRSASAVASLCVLNILNIGIADSNRKQ